MTIIYMHELMENLKLTQSKRVGIEIEETGFHTRVTRLTRDTLASNTSANISSCSVVYTVILIISIVFIK